MKGRFPGLLRPRMDPDLLMMICTAGHVDHGKTSLVKLLTGCNTDRLKEEQERKLTIELGFAPCVLSGDVYVGIVDVPGHEKFVRNMVAGVSGIDMVVMVIAADDGIMPQTVEHFRILEILGVRHGMVALTKIDRVAAERVQEVTGQVEEFFEGTFMQGAKICPVSSETFDGFSAFYETLVAEVHGLKKRRSNGVFRMPVLNSFVSEGHGNVVTGIPVDGTIAVGQQVELVPGHRKGKVRSLQRFLRDASEGGFGQCLAINVPEFGKTPPERGQVICRPGYLRAHQSFHLFLKAIPGLSRALKNAEEVKFHTGTSEESAKLYLLEGKTLEAGQSGLATVVLQGKVAAALHDKFILRRLSPATTVAGGEIIGMFEGARRIQKKRSTEQLRTFLDFFATAGPAGPLREEKEIEFFLLSARPAGAPLQEIAWGTLLPRDLTEGHLARLVESSRVLKPAPDHFIHAESYRACLAETRDRIRELAARQETLSLTVADLRRGTDWPAPLWNRIQEELEQEGLISRRGEKVALETAADDLGPEDRALKERLLALYEEQGFRSPRPDELPERLRAPQENTDRLLDYLCARGDLYRLGKNVVLSRSWLREAQGKVIAAVEEKGVLDSADFKLLIGSTRKYALAILDFLDARGVTTRSGNDRRLSPDFRKLML
ncbi:MAG: selenocysteine-specific translation elongation factor [Planctomycetota bacterium]